MPDLFYIFSKRWKQVLLITAFVTIIAAVVSLLLPKQYLSTVTALPANSLNADKSAFFNPNIQHLYSYLGTADELDKFEGTARLDTLYKATAQELSLAKHYNLDEQYKVVKELKKNTKISRTEYGELRIKVWDKEASMAANIANSLYKNLQEIHQNLQNQASKIILERLYINYDSLRNISSTANKSKIDTSADLSDGKEQRVPASLNAEYLNQHQKLISEYQMHVNLNPPTLLLVETASASGKPDKPMIPEIIVVTFFAVFLISLLVVVFLESRK
jgi:capsular polysaccharide biosynthesis protein